MSTPDQPDTPPLTRKRLREIRNTGATPIIPPAGEEPPAEPEVETPAPAPTPTPAPLPRAAEPAPVAPAPDPQVDLGVAPLTRRQARAQERIRTASVPIIAPDAIGAPVERQDAAPSVISDVPAPSETAGAEGPAEPETVEAEIIEPEVAAPESDSSPSVPDDEVVAEEIVAVEPVQDDSSETESDTAAAVPVDAVPVEAEPVEAEDEKQPDADQPARTVHPGFGSELLGGEAPAASLPPSFDQLIARSTSATGSIATPNALILSQTPAGAPLVSPITATGEVLITGTFELPEGLGSMGHAPGTADGKDLDVALIDGELPAASSPTPIAASAAISTVRNSGEEIIRPPAPEKGGRLMLTLVITAGVLALALAGVLILTITTGRI